MHTYTYKCMYAQVYNYMDILNLKLPINININDLDFDDSIPNLF